MPKTENDWLFLCHNKKSLWTHNGDKRRPHILLNSGQHSNGFFNPQALYSDEVLFMEALAYLLRLFMNQRENVSTVDGIVGCDSRADVFSCFFREFFSDSVSECFFVSPIKWKLDTGVTMAFHEEEMDLFPGKTVLLCNEVLTDGHAVERISRAVEKASGIVLPFVLVLMNQSGLTKVDGKKIIALINQQIHTWAPDACPLCKEGSEAIEPVNNWTRLTGHY